MKTKQLGNSDLFITPVGFGAWAIGGAGWEFAWGEQDDKASIAAIHRALELGVNWIDTAAVYGMGHSEEIVARALKTWPGKRPYVFTKCALRWDEQGKVDHVLKANSIRRECEDSLRRLRVETIDLFQIHWPVENAAEVAEGWQAMKQLQDQGKVRWIGVSNFNVVAKEIYRLAIRDGDSDKDFSAIYHYLARDYDINPNGNRHLDQSDDTSSNPSMTVYAHDN